MQLADMDPVRQTTPPKNQDVISKILIKTNIGGWYFDAFIKISHDSQLQITEHPVETGASVSDHSYMEPKELTIEVAMSDAAKSYIKGQFTGGKTRSIMAAQILAELQSSRVPVQITTRLAVYKNMLLKTLSIPDDVTTKEGLKATAVFREVIVAKVGTATVSKRASVTNTSNTGAKQPVDANNSMLKQLMDLLLKGG